MNVPAKIIRFALLSVILGITFLGSVQPASAFSLNPFKAVKSIAKAAVSVGKAVVKAGSTVVSATAKGAVGVVKTAVKFEGAVLKTTGKLAVGVVKTAVKFDGAVIKATGKLAGGVIKTTGKIAIGAAKETGKIAGVAVKLTGGIYSEAFKMSSRIAVGAGKGLLSGGSLLGSGVFKIANAKDPLKAVRQVAVLGTPLAPFIGANQSLKSIKNPPRVKDLFRPAPTIAGLARSAPSTTISPTSAILSVPKPLPLPKAGYAASRPPVTAPAAMERIQLGQKQTLDATKRRPEDVKRTIGEMKQRMEAKRAIGEPRQKMDDQKPTLSQSRPVTAAPKQMITSLKPTNGGQKPVVATSKPIMAAPKPMIVAPKPMISGLSSIGKRH